VLQNAGFTIVSPSPTAPWTGAPDANGNLLVVSWSPPQPFTPPPLSFTIAGNTGLGGDASKYLDQPGGGLFGSLNGSAQVNLKVTMGVDVNGQGQLNFFLAPTPNALSVSFNTSTGDPLSGNLVIGDLANVNASATGSLNISATAGFQTTAADTDGKIRVS